MNVTIFGIGYVGLVTAACLAHVGNHVVCVDVSQEKVDGLNNGIIPIYEPGLDELVDANRQAGRLSFTLDACAALKKSDVVFIAVGTPPDQDGSADLTHVLAVAKTIAQFLDHDAIVVNKSTVPVGTAELVDQTLRDGLRTRGIDINFSVVSNPEFLKEGAAIEDCMRPDRIIIGSRDEHAIETLRRLYKPFNRNHERIVVMDPRSAELTKYAANAMLATKISFINEIANLAERVGADIEYVRQGIGSDPRIGYSFIYAGAGYGGSCFPKDVKALIRIGENHAYIPQILQAVERVNEEQKKTLFSKIVKHYGTEDLSDKTFAVWGLAFKPNTDDMREASSRVLLNQLFQAGARVRAYDPEAMDESRRIWGTDHPLLTLCSDAEETLDGAHALVLITEWKCFWSPDPHKLAHKLTDKVVFDGRNIYNPYELEAAGLSYYGIGRGRSISTDLPFNPA